MVKAKVVDLFGAVYKEAPDDSDPSSSNDEAKKTKGDEARSKSKDDRTERLIDSYCVYLNGIINWGSCNDCFEAADLIKIAQIKLCIATSKHPKAVVLGPLYDKVVDIVRGTRSASDFAAWQKAIDDEIARLRNANNMSALTCPTDKWSDRNSEGKPKSPILCAIVAIRAYLERQKFTLREDIWKSYCVITNEHGKEEYVSRHTDQILREWRNGIYEHKGTMPSLEVTKDAFHQIAKYNEYHSLREKIKSIAIDKDDLYEGGAKAFGLKITGEGEENHFTVRAFRHHLIASMARVFYPGVWYDLVLCVFGKQGSGKTTGLRILYGRDNCISCNFFELDPKKQSEATRQGIACVENADTFGDARKADFNRIKADVSTDSFVGRDAYGRMEDMRRVNYQYVIWYTGNEVKVLRDPTGNRRFIIVYSEAPTDEDWLRLNGDQLMAQAYRDMEKLRSDYLDGMRAKGLKEDYPKYLELPRDMWEESQRRQGASMVEGAAWEDWVPELIFQKFVVWPAKISGNICIDVLTRDISNYLQERSRKTLVSEQTIAAAMKKCVVLSKDNCEGLNDDIKWMPQQIHRNHANLRGYQINFIGEMGRRAFEIIKKIVADENDPTQAYIDGNRPM